MLLCVGHFFGSTEEDRKTWQEYLDGVSKGLYQLCFTHYNYYIVTYKINIVFCKYTYLAVPIFTYILGPSTAEELPMYENVELGRGGELCENITFLGKKLKTQISNECHLCNHTVSAWVHYR